MIHGFELPVAIVGEKATGYPRRGTPIPSPDTPGLITEPAILAVERNTVIRMVPKLGPVINWRRYPWY